SRAQRSPKRMLASEVPRRTRASVFVTLLTPLHLTEPVRTTVGAKGLLNRLQPTRGTSSWEEQVRWVSSFHAAGALSLPHRRGVSDRLRATAGPLSRVPSSPVSCWHTNALSDPKYFHNSAETGLPTTYSPPVGSPL